GGGEVAAAQLALAEAVDARVLEEATDDAGDGDVVRVTRHARHEAADAADDEVDLHAGAAGLAELVDQVALGDGVRLDDDPAAVAAGDLLVDQAHEAVFH